MIRPEVREFVALGPLPESAAATEDGLERQGAFLKRIDAPVSDDEAELLATRFGPDDCFGLAWSLLHLIETAPGAGRRRPQPPPSANEWVRRLWHRASRAW